VFATQQTAPAPAHHSLSRLTFPCTRRLPRTGKGSSGLNSAILLVPLRTLSHVVSYSYALFCRFLHAPKTQPLYFQTIPHSFKKTSGVGCTLLSASDRHSSIASDSKALLSPLQSALPQNTPVTPLESAHPKSSRTKLFTISTYKKTGGWGGHTKWYRPGTSLTE
jgi:hypothetical protein